MKIHPKGSLEDIITNLIKNWEKELSHKANPNQWLTAIADRFRMSVNGGPWASLEEVGKIGAYNAFLGNCEYYSAAHISDPLASHQVFREALKSGFALEVLEVYTPPPKVAFKFRHWGYMSGELKCPMRNGEMMELAPHNGKVEIYGMVVMKLSEKFQILEMEFFFRPDTMMEQMVKGQ
ncbi:unnamed protein product [Orchesella dallaii]|uniref:Pathogen-related protein n=1 Tax=Orchesella dallaii TaxID=48710 RepID=A0ABP1QF82_9HEXA